MLVSDIIARVTAVSNLTPGNSFCISKINECMEDLALEYDSAKARNSTTQTCTDVEAWYELPAACIGVYRVDDPNANEIRRFTIKDGQLIQFDYEDTFTIYYYTYQTEVTLVTETPGVHVSFHGAMPYYIAFKWMMRKDPANPRISNMLDTYNDRVEKAYTALYRAKTRHRRIAKSNESY
jgi:hypothetical protein